MPRDFSIFTIQSADVLHGLRKWDGRDKVLEGGKHIERHWQATDREFIEGFAAGKITNELLSRFAAKNDNDVASKRTGGYSVTRKFWGGLSSWRPRLQEFYTSDVLPCRDQYTQVRRVEPAWEMTIKLAEMQGTSAKGFSSPLGIVAASKLLFFACPEIPIFIYDSVVGIALSMDKLAIEEYPKWWNRCNDVLKNNPSAIPLLPTNRQVEFQDKEEWFTRRSFDLMLYRLGDQRINGC